MNELIKSLRQKSIDSCFSALQREDTPLALATVVQAVSPTSGKPGDKALVGQDAIVEGWIGGGCAQPAVIEAAGSALESGESRLIRVGPKGEWEPMSGIEDFASGCLSGGTLLIFIEPMIKQPALTILGNSPAAHSLCRLAAEVGFTVTLAYPGLEPGGAADNVRLLRDFIEIDGDYLVIATQGKFDREAMKAALAPRVLGIDIDDSATPFTGTTSSGNDLHLDPLSFVSVAASPATAQDWVTPADLYILLIDSRSIPA